MRGVRYLLYVMLSVQTFASFMLPMKFDKRIDGYRGYQEYQIQNSTNKTVRYKVYKKSDPKDLEVKGVVGDMTKWIEYYPKILTIPPKSTGIIKLAIKAPSKTREGEYVARIGTNPLSIPKMEESVDGGVTPQISVPVGFEMNIFGYVGDLAPKIEGDFKTIEENGERYFKGNIKNIGTAGMKMIAVYRYKDSDGEHNNIVPLGRVVVGAEVSIDTKPLKNIGNHRAIELEIKEDGGSKSFFKVR